MTDQQIMKQAVQLERVIQANERAALVNMLLKSEEEEYRKIARECGATEQCINNILGGMRI